MANGVMALKGFGGVGARILKKLGEKDKLLSTIEEMTRGCMCYLPEASDIIRGLVRESR